MKISSAQDQRPSNTILPSWAKSPGTPKTSQSFFGSYEIPFHRRKLSKLLVFRNFVRIIMFQKQLLYTLMLAYLDLRNKIVQKPHFTSRVINLLSEALSGNVFVLINMKTGHSAGPVLC